ncbi:MAG: hypothetical protein HZB51_13440 [Chloroflexi bacterium]|nr:hypothetical protein [Chloroflexota bacterium]
MSYLFTVLLFFYLILFANAHADLPLFQSFVQRDGLAGNFVTRVAFAPDGAAWLATSKGATKAQGKSWVTFTSAHGLGNSWVNDIVVSGDKTYFATNGGGLSLLDGTTWKTFNTSNSAIPSNYVTAMAVDKQNRVWIGTLGYGVSRLDGDQWTKHSLANNYVNALALDANGNPWVATSNGAFFFDGKTWVQLTQSTGLASSRVNTLTIAPDGRLWFGTDNGVTAYDGKTYRSYKKSDGLADNAVTAIAVDSSRVWVGTTRGLSVLENGKWKTLTRADGLVDDTINALAIDANKNVWVGTPHGLSIFGGASLVPATTLPVVLVHGWHTADSDQLDDTEFRFIRRYLQQDGIQVFYAQGISPYKTLFQNAATLRDVIADVKAKTGAKQVDIIAFSMGGLNTRSYLESSYYQNDANGTFSVRRAIILGTPMAGVQMWYSLLTREIQDRPTEPSVIELTPEYADLFNRTHAPPVTVPYDLLIGDVRGQSGLELLKDFPPNDGLIDVWSAHALNGPQVRRVTNADAHDWSPSPSIINVTAYLYPEQTYQRFIRNALRDPDTRPIDSAAAPVDPIQPRNITPMNIDTLRASDTITRSIVIDTNRATRFISRWNTGDADVKLRAPDGTLYTPTTVRDSFSQNAVIVPGATKKGSLDGAYLKADIGNIIFYSIPHAQSGTWSLIATRLDKGDKLMLLTSYADLDADLKLNAKTDRAWYIPGQPINIEASLSNKASGTDVRVRIEWLGEGKSPRGDATEYRLSEQANTGTYTQAITGLTRGGYYLARITARGTNLARERETIFAVSPQTASLGTNVSARADASGITVNASVNATRAGDFALGVTLRDTRGQLVASLTAPVTLQAGTQSVSVKIPGYQIRARGIDGPYVVDLILMDASFAAVQVDERTKAFTTDAYRANDFSQ